jgi:hypothetical protein
VGIGDINALPFCLQANRRAFFPIAQQDKNHTIEMSQKILSFKKMALKIRKITKLKLAKKYYLSKRWL